MQHSIVILRSYVLKPQSMCITQTCKWKLFKMPKNLGLVGGRVVTLLRYNGKFFWPLSSWDRNYKLGPTLFKESRPRFNSNQAFLSVQKMKSTPKGFILGVKIEIEKIFSICPKLLINVELYDFILAPRLKKDSNEFGKPICNPWCHCLFI
jgi:hypothetical protein